MNRIDPQPEPIEPTQPTEPAEPDDGTPEPDDAAGAASPDETKTQVLPTDEPHATTESLTTTESATEAPVSLDKARPAEHDATPTPTPSPTLAPSRTTAGHPPRRPVSRRLRVGTAVWGLMLAAAGVWIIAWAGGARIDAGLALIVLLAGGGAALLVGSIVAGSRRQHRTDRT